MSKVWRALIVSAVATGAAAAAWTLVTRWRDEAVQIGSAKANLPERSREDEIDALTQEQKDLMLREMSQHV